MSSTRVSVFQSRHAACSALALSLPRLLTTRTQQPKVFALWADHAPDAAAAMARLSRGKPYDLVLIEPDLQPDLMGSRGEAGRGEASGYALCTWWRERAAALQAAPVVGGSSCSSRSGRGRGSRSGSSSNGSGRGRGSGQ